MRRFHQLHTAALALGMIVLTTAASPAAERTTTLSPTADEPIRTNRDDVTTRKPSITPEQAEDFPILNPEAELEATDIYFTYDFHFGTDTAHSHRVEAAITNIDTTWSAWNRTWEIYSFPPGGSMYGIYLVDAGSVPPLAPGETYDFVRWLPSSVNVNATYVLILSEGDANRDNDIAVDTP